MMLATFRFCHAQQNIDDKYIADRVSKVNEYTLLLWSVAPNTAPRDSVDKWKNEHLRIFFQLQSEGKISFFGPVAKDPSIVGLAVFNTNDHAVVKQYVEKDPFVKNNVLTYRLSKWYCVPDQKLMPSSVGNK
jgi:uncharacterized protein YciI